MHTVTIHRGETEISLLQKECIDFSVAQKKGGEKVYKTDATLKIEVEELRVGDILEVAYTERGFQEDMKGKINFMSQRESDEYTDRKVVRFVFDPERQMKYKSTKEIQAPVVSQVEGLTEWVWEWENIKKLSISSFYESPDWYSNASKVMVSDFVNYQEIVNLHLPNFDMEAPPSEAVRQHVKKIVNPEDPVTNQINTILAFTQNEIHYLTNSYYTPVQPDSVLFYGYGDCKAKSLLTCKMLACIGVEAWPVLVKHKGLSTEFEDFPSLHNFDHMIVAFRYDEKRHFFDGTMREQGGAYDEKYYLPFRKGLWVKKGSHSLVDIPPSPNFKQHIYDEFELPKGNSLGEIKRTVHFLGGEADDLRQIYKAGKVSGVQRFLDNKNHWTPGKSVGNITKLRYQDLNAQGTNEVIVSNLVYPGVVSQDQEDGGYRYYEYRVEPIFSLLPKQYDFNFRSDFYFTLPFPHHFLIELKVPYPYDSLFEEEEIEVKTPQFYFKKEATYKDSAFFIQLELQMLKDYLKEEEIQEYNAQRREVLEAAMLRFSLPISEQEQTPGQTESVYTLGDASEYYIPFDTLADSVVIEPVIPAEKPTEAPRSIILIAGIFLLLLLGVGGGLLSQHRKA